MPRSKQKPKATGRTAAQRSGNTAGATARQVGELAWRGQHTRAIEVATAALAASCLSVGDQLDLLDLRAHVDFRPNPNSTEVCVAALGAIRMRHYESTRHSMTF